MADYADVSDVENIWRPAVDQAERDRIAGRIRQASQLVRDEVPLVDGLSVDERIEAGSLSWATVRDVVVEMVERVIAVGRFVRQKSVTVDDGTTSQTFDSSVSGGEMFLSPAQLRRLTGATNRRGGRAFTITLGPSTAWT